MPLLAVSIVPVRRNSPNLVARLYAQLRRISRGAENHCQRAVCVRLCVGCRSKTYNFSRIFLSHIHHLYRL